MSRLSDYSRFDHIDSEDEETEPQPALEASAAPPPVAAAGPSLVQVGAAPSHRFALQYQGATIYEWEQSLNEVTIYIPTPPMVHTAQQLDCRIHAQRLQVGLAGNDRFLIDEATFGSIEVQSSTWTWEEGMLTIELQKANKGVVWQAACLGPAGQVRVLLNPAQVEQENQRLLLERWQEENPGMDFRGASFNGGAPDPRTYMGGVGYQ
jgi:hypothetical protein